MSEGSTGSSRALARASAAVTVRLRHSSTQVAVHRIAAVRKLGAELSCSAPITLGRNLLEPALQAGVAAERDAGGFHAMPMSRCCPHRRRTAGRVSRLISGRRSSTAATVRATPSSLADVPRCRRWRCSGSRDRPSTREVWEQAWPRPSAISFWAEG
jgi:hypothetical protein